MSGRSTPALRAAIARTQHRMRELETAVGWPVPCCYFCACGPEYHHLVAKYGRQAAWLAVLLRKRGENDEARYWEWEAG